MVRTGRFTQQVRLCPFLQHGEVAWLRVTQWDELPSCQTAAMVVDVSRFDAAPLIAFIAAKETNYGIETNG